QACRAHYRRPVAIALWALAEVAIVACDLAEVLGTAIALKLLFDIPLVWGVLVTAFDVFLILALQRYGFRKIEAFIVALL
ncbi:divalent metal cation transporter, partial [Escherichia coli]|nr:divalent metal cation transporter [Escherichia coli]